MNWWWFVVGCWSCGLYCWWVGWLFLVFVIGVVVCGCELVLDGFFVFVWWLLWFGGCVGCVWLFVWFVCWLCIGCWLYCCSWCVVVNMRMFRMFYVVCCCDLLLMGGFWSCGWCWWRYCWWFLLCLVICLFRYFLGNCLLCCVVFFLVLVGRYYWRRMFCFFCFR